ncbi:AI-2E family transporter [Limnobacter litoralis]|uniref:AI-2E family transporter n=1 Tax=Limnobacter litoralis TaxID=481366 RepID=A0ABQ5YPU3_9BURK|nr:AI-2E family transporter [Limnobacter litoralis]GLR26628.1 AI-2E family transporter [Limnobacter litoralis]
MPSDNLNSPARDELRLSTLAKRFYLDHWGLLLSVFLIFALLVSLWSVLAPFVAAFAIAYVLSKPSLWLYGKLRQKVPLPVCALLAFGILLLLLSSLAMLFIPVVGTQLELIQSNLPQLLVNFKANLLPRINSLFGVSLSVDSNALRDTVAHYISDNRGVLASLSSRLLRSGSQSVLGVTGFVSLMTVATLFILPGWQQINRQVRQVFPPHVWKRVHPLALEIDTVMSQYMKGVLTVMLFLGTFYAVGLSLVGVQSGWAIGVLAGLLSIVPYLGFATALLIALLTASLELQGFLPVLLVLLVFVLGQIIEGFVLTPMVVGDKIGLSALAVVFALAFFGAVFGFAGVFLALPLAAIFKVAYVYLFNRFQNSAYYRQGESS